MVVLVSIFKKGLYISHEISSLGAKQPLKRLILAGYSNYVLTLLLAFCLFFPNQVKHLKLD